MSIIKNFEEFKKYTKKGIEKIGGEYKILNTKVNNWEGFSTFIDGKDKNGNIFKKKKGIILNQFTILYQNNNNDIDNLLYKELFINEIKKERKVNNKKNKKNMKNVSKDYFTEIVFKKIDLTGEIIDIDSIIDDYKIKINEIFKKIKVFNVNNIVIPLDNNIVVYDLERVKEDEQYYKMVLKVRGFIVNLIKFIYNKNKDTKINVIVLKNDNSDNMFLPIGDVLDIYFQDNNNIIIDNKKEEQNKKFIFGSNYILYTQDEKIRDNDLVNFLFQKVNKKGEFYNTYEIHKGYILKDNNFKKIYVNEILGVVIRNIMSLNNFTKSTLLTNKKEYSVNNNKIIEAYIYHKNKGFISNIIEKGQ